MPSKTQKSAPNDEGMRQRTFSFASSEEKGSDQSMIDHTASNKSAPSVRRGGSQMEVVGGRGMGRGGGHLAKVEMGVMGAQI